MGTEIDGAIASAPDHDEDKDDQYVGSGEGDDDHDAASTQEKDGSKTISSKEETVSPGKAAQTGSPHLLGNMDTSSPGGVSETRKVEVSSHRKESIHESHVDADEKSTESDHAILDRVSEWEDNSRVNIAETLIMIANQVHEPHAESSPKGIHEGIENESIPPNNGPQSDAASATRDVSVDLGPKSTGHNLSSTKTCRGIVCRGESGGSLDDGETERLVPVDQVEGNASSLVEIS
jgi:hypothetical protein